MRPCVYIFLSSGRIILFKYTMPRYITQKILLLQMLQQSFFVIIIAFFPSILAFCTFARIRVFMHIFDSQLLYFQRENG